MKYLLRVDYEVSGNLHANTNPNQFDESTWDLTAYPKAFAHVRQLFLAVLPNVDFVYHAVRGEAKQLYPGDTAVDWNGSLIVLVLRKQDLTKVGFSIFNNDVCLPVGDTSNCDGSKIDPNLQADIAWAPKPKLVAESAVQPPPSGGPNGFIDYLTRVKNVVEQNNFAAWTYINSNWPAHDWPTDTWGDSRIEAVPAVETWFESNLSGNARYMFG